MDKILMVDDDELVLMIMVKNIVVSRAVRAKGAFGRRSGEKNAEQYF